MENRFKKGDIARIISSPLAALVGKLVEIEEIDGDKCVVTFDEDEDVKVRQKLVCDRLELVSAANQETKDFVSHPYHYHQGGIECFDVIKEFYGQSEFEHFCLGNVLKYVMRCKKKGKYLEDLKKARFYLDTIINLCEKRLNDEKI